VEGLLCRLRRITVQHTATHCNTLQHTATQLKNARVTTMWKGYYAASDTQHWIDELVCCSVLYCVAVCCSVCEYSNKPLQTRNNGRTSGYNFSKVTATHCNTLQNAAAHHLVQPLKSHCNPQQQTATHCNALRHINWNNFSNVNSRLLIESR